MRQRRARHAERESAWAWQGKHCLGDKKAMGRVDKEARGIISDLKRRCYRSVGRREVNRRGLGKSVS